MDECFPVENSPPRSLPSDFEAFAKKQAEKQIPFTPFDKSFSEDERDYFSFGDKVEPMSLRRSLRKGDILEITVLSIANPGYFHIRILGPDHLLDNQWRSLSQLTERMSAFYEQCKSKDVLKIDDTGFLEGMYVKKLETFTLCIMKFLK